MLSKTNQLLEVETKLRTETEAHVSDLEASLTILKEENSKLKEELEASQHKYNQCYEKLISGQKFLDTLKTHIKEILNPLIGKSYFSILVHYHSD